MKKTNNVIKVFIAAISLLSVMVLNSCNKSMQDKAAPLQDNSVDDGILSTSPITMWNFDSSWTESVHNLTGIPHNKVKFSNTMQARNGISAFYSKDSGYVSYANPGPLTRLSKGLTVDFWVYAIPQEGGAQCIWCLPQTGAFWPTQHVLLDGYNSSQGDSGLIKVMFKANKAIDYNEQWTQVSGIPKFYNRWSHVQYSYKGKNSKFTLIINGKKYFDHVVLYDGGDTTTRKPLGNLVANPGPHGIVIGAFQNTWNPALFGERQSWMLPFKGRIDDLKIYNSALF
jgi:hypothetical protein